MPHWHYAMLELAPADHLVRPMIGPETDLTRDQAHAEIAAQLDKLASNGPRVRQLAAMWQRGAKDDTVYLGPFIFTIFECRTTCAAGAQTMLDSFAEVYRSAGINATSVKIPDSWPG